MSSIFQQLHFPKNFCDPYFFFNTAPRFIREGAIKAHLIKDAIPDLTLDDVMSFDLDKVGKLFQEQLKHCIPHVMYTLGRVTAFYIASQSCFWGTLYHIVAAGHGLSEVPAAKKRESFVQGHRTKVINIVTTSLEHVIKAVYCFCIYKFKYFYLISLLTFTFTPQRFLTVQDYLFHPRRLTKLVAEQNSPANIEQGKIHEVKMTLGTTHYTFQYVNDIAQNNNQDAPPVNFIKCQWVKNVDQNEEQQESGSCFFETDHEVTDETVYAMMREGMVPREADKSRYSYSLTGQLARKIAHFLVPKPALPLSADAEKHISPQDEQKQQQQGDALSSSSSDPDSPVHVERPQENKEDN